MLLPYAFLKVLNTKCLFTVNFLKVFLNIIILRLNLYFSLNFIFTFWYWTKLRQVIYVLSRRTRMMKELLRMLVLNRIEKITLSFQRKVWPQRRKRSLLINYRTVGGELRGRKNCSVFKKKQSKLFCLCQYNYHCHYHYQQYLLFHICIISIIQTPTWK